MKNKRIFRILSMVLALTMVMTNVNLTAFAMEDVQGVEVNNEVVAEYDADVEVDEVSGDAEVAESEHEHENVVEEDSGEAGESDGEGESDGVENTEESKDESIESTNGESVEGGESDGTEGESIENSENTDGVEGESGENSEVEGTEGSDENGEVDGTEESDKIDGTEGTEGESGESGEVDGTENTDGNGDVDGTEEPDEKEENTEDGTEEDEEAEAISYEILDGADQTVAVGESVRVRVDADISKFQSVEVDGAEVESSNYEVTEGSTIVEFNSEYVGSLESGEHSVNVVFEDGTASTTFTIEEDKATTHTVNFYALQVISNDDIDGADEPVESEDIVEYVNVLTVEVTDGETIEEYPEIENVDGYEFLNGWTIGENGSDIDNEHIITEDLNLYAKYKEVDASYTVTFYVLQEVGADSVDSVDSVSSNTEDSVDNTNTTDVEYVQIKTVETVDGRIEELPEVSDVEGWKFNNVWTVGKNTDVKFNIDNNIEEDLELYASYDEDREWKIRFYVLEDCKELDGSEETSEESALYNKFEDNMSNNDIEYKYIKYMEIETVDRKIPEMPVVEDEQPEWSGNWVDVETMENVNADTVFEKDTDIFAEYIDATADIPDTREWNVNGTTYRAEDAECMAFIYKGDICYDVIRYSDGMVLYVQSEYTADDLNDTKIGTKYLKYTDVVIKDSVSSVWFEDVITELWGTHDAWSSRTDVYSKYIKNYNSDTGGSKVDIVNTEVIPYRFDGFTLDVSFNNVIKIGNRCFSASTGEINITADLSKIVQVGDRSFYGTYAKDIFLHGRRHNLAQCVSVGFSFNNAVLDDGAVVVLNSLKTAGSDAFSIIGYKDSVSSIDDARIFDIPNGLPVLESAGDYSFSGPLQYVKFGDNTTNVVNYPNMISAGRDALSWKLYSACVKDDGSLGYDATIEVILDIPNIVSVGRGAFAMRGLSQINDMPKLDVIYDGAFTSKTLRSCLQSYKDYKGYQTVIKQDEKFSTIVGVYPEDMNDSNSPFYMIREMALFKLGDTNGHNLDLYNKCGIITSGYSFNSEEGNHQYELDIEYIGDKLEISDVSDIGSLSLSDNDFKIKSKMSHYTESGRVFEDIEFTPAMCNFKKLSNFTDDDLVKYSNNDYRLLVEVNVTFTGFTAPPNTHLEHTRSTEYAWIPIKIVIVKVPTALKITYLGDNELREESIVNKDEIAIAATYQISYSDGTTEEVTEDLDINDFNLTDEDLTVKYGTNTITLNYTENGKTVSGSFEVTGLCTHQNTTTTVTKQPTYWADGEEAEVCDQCYEEINVQTVARVEDTTAPEITIAIGNNEWKNFLNNISFGLLFKERPEAKVSVTDNESGITDVEYWIAAVGEEYLRNHNYQIVLGCTAKDNATTDFNNSTNMFWIVEDDGSPNTGDIRYSGSVSYSGEHKASHRDTIDMYHLNKFVIVHTRNAQGKESWATSNGVVIDVYKPQVAIYDKVGDDVTGNDIVYDSTSDEDGAVVTCISEFKMIVRDITAIKYEVKKDGVVLEAGTMDSFSVSNAGYGKEFEYTDAGTYAIKMIDKVGNVTTVNVVLDELGHDYGEQTETWSADYSEVTLKRVCSRDESHVLNETLTTTYVETKAPKCEETGTGTYTGTPTKDGLTAVTKDVVVDATGHDWGTPVYTWQNNDSEVYAKAICNNDNSHIIEETATVTHDIIKPATCEEDGSQGNVARFTKDVFEDQSKDATVINKLGHDLKETITVQPTLGGVEAVKKYDCQRDGCDYSKTTTEVTRTLTDVEIQPDTIEKFEGEKVAPEDIEKVVLKYHIEFDDGTEMDVTFEVTPDEIGEDGSIDDGKDGVPDGSVIIPDNDLTISDTTVTVTINPTTGDPVIENFPINVSEHTYSTEWTVDKAPTCTEDGEKSHHCTDVGYEDLKKDVTKVDKLGHDLDDGTYYEPTFDRNGYTEKKCKRDGCDYSEVIQDFPSTQLVSVASIKGKIVDTNGNPVAGRVVALHSLLQVTTTNANGEFMFANVEAGSHKLIMTDYTDVSQVTKENLDSIDVCAYITFDVDNLGFSNVVAEVIHDGVIDLAHSSIGTNGNVTLTIKAEEKPKPDKPSDGGNNDDNNDDDDDVNKHEEPDNTTNLTVFESQLTQPQLIQPQYNPVIYVGDDGKVLPDKLPQTGIDPFNPEGSVEAVTGKGDELDAPTVIMFLFALFMCGGLAWYEWNDRKKKGVK